MPGYLKDQLKVSDIFDAKSQQYPPGIENYYKYMIVYNTTEIEMEEENLIKLLNKDFENKNWKLTVDDIYTFLKEKPILEKMSLFIKNKTNKFRFIQEFKSKIERSDLNELIKFFENFKNQHIYVLTGAIANKDLAGYIQDQQKSKKFSNNLEQILLELHKLAKHVLKGLIALHDKSRAMCDIHPGNIVVTDVTKPGGKTNRIKYQLIDFRSSEVLSPENSEALIKDDLYRLGYALLIPTFWALNDKELTKIPNSTNYSTLNEIEDKVSTTGKSGKRFVSFLEKLRDKEFASASEALHEIF